MRESYIENYLHERVKLAGGVSRKIQYIGRDSCPDRLIGFNGRHWLIELKRPSMKDHTRAAQLREHERLREVGFDVRVIATLEEVDRFLLEIQGG